MVLALIKPFARVVELVDTQDLKSCNHCDCTSSILVPGTKQVIKTLYFKGFFCFWEFQSNNSVTNINEKAKITALIISMITGANYESIINMIK